jgi:hypothetical protein
MSAVKDVAEQDDERGPRPEIAPLRVVIRPMATSWEAEVFAENKTVLVLHGDGAIQRATNALELEPLPTRKIPFSRDEWRRIDAIFREHDERVRAARRAA